LKGNTGERGAAGASGATRATGATGPAGLGVTPSSSVSPAYDSGWINITQMAGQNIVLDHNLGTTNISADIQGRTTATGGIHQKNLGLTGYTSGWTKVEGETGHDYANGNNVQTQDGGYAISGFKSSISAGSRNVRLIKTNSVGNRVKHNLRRTLR
jgi:hypothetical protein